MNKQLEKIMPLITPVSVIMGVLLSSYLNEWISFREILYEYEKEKGRKTRICFFYSMDGEGEFI